MDKQDSRILEALQNDFPLSERPYEIIAEKLGLPVDKLWGRIEQLIADGVIRRIGASLDSRKLGYSSTLAAVSVKADLIDKAAEVIAEFPQVTHSYQRDDRFNIWFTVIADSQESIERILEQIRTSLSLESSQVLNSPVRQLFKLDARFSVPPKS